MIDFTDIQITQIEGIIKEARIQKKITQTEIGERIGVKKSRMSIIEGNLGSLSTDKFLKLIKELGCSLHFTPNLNTNVNAAEVIKFLDKVIEDWQSKKITAEVALRKITKKLK